MGLGLESNAAEGADATAAQLGAEVEEVLGAIAEGQAPRVGGIELRGRPVVTSNKRFCGGVKSRQWGLRRNTSSIVAIALWHRVDVSAGGRIVGCRTGLEIKIGNIQLIPRRQIPVGKAANAEILAEVGGRVVSDARRNHGSGVGCTVKGAGGACSRGGGSLPLKVCCQRVTGPRRTSRPRRHNQRMSGIPVSGVTDITSKIPATKRLADDSRDGL